MAEDATKPTGWSRCGSCGKAPRPSCHQCEGKGMVRDDPKPAPADAEQPR
jgi:DnaJ-class molecular chaperone